MVGEPPNTGRLRFVTNKRCPFAQKVRRRARASPLVRSMPMLEILALFVMFRLRRVRCPRTVPPGLDSAGGVQPEGLRCE